MNTFEFREIIQWKKDVKLKNRKDIKKKGAINNLAEQGPIYRERKNQKGTDLKISM